MAVTGLLRFWFEFDVDASPEARRMPWVGVTAWTLSDAEEIMRTKLFRGEDLPVVHKLIENVDVSTLDERHVRTHMAPPVARGVWYPMGFADV